MNIFVVSSLTQLANHEYSRDILRLVIICLASEAKSANLYLAVNVLFFAEIKRLYFIGFNFILSGVNGRETCSNFVTEDGNS